MPRNIDDPGWRDLQSKIHEAISSFSAELGARECEHGDWGDCEENDGQGCPFNETRPKPGAMPIVQHWVLVVATPNVASSAKDIDEVMIVPPDQGGFITNGLLWEGLYG